MRKGVSQKFKGEVAFDMQELGQDMGFMKMVSLPVCARLSGSCRMKGLGRGRIILSLMYMNVSLLDQPDWETY